MWVLIIIIAVVLVVVWLNYNNPNIIQGNSKPRNSNKSSKLSFPPVDESQLNDDLSSALGIDYRTLRNFLAVGDFESANKETLAIFQKLIYPHAKKPLSQDHLQIDDDEIYQARVERIPCTDICTIDRLWVKYSTGHFGFSIQSEIAQQLNEQFYEEIVEFNYKEKVNMIEQEVVLRAALKTKEAFEKQIKWDKASLNDRGLIFNRSAPRGHLPKILWSEPIFGYKNLIKLLKRVGDCF